MHLDRRRALRQIVLGGTGVAATSLWGDRLLAQALGHSAEAHAQVAASAATGEWAPKVLSAEQNQTVVILTELIIPRTDTPGAAAALVNRYVDVMLDDAEDEDREAFLRGLAQLDARSVAEHGVPFRKASAEQQTALLTAISLPSSEATEGEGGTEFFRVLKGLTVTGFYTSEIGMRELGDDGNLFFDDYVGCLHPEHQDPGAAVAGGE